MHGLVRPYVTLSTFDNGRQQNVCDVLSIRLNIISILYISSLHISLVGKIPPESTLIFHIDLLEIRNGPRSHESFQEMDLNDDWKLSKEEVNMLVYTAVYRKG